MKVGSNWQATSFRGRHKGAKKTPVSVEVRKVVKKDEKRKAKRFVTY